MKNLILDLLAIGTLSSSLLVITSKNPVISVIFLISVFVNAAGYLIILGVGFIGISYIIVYVGAIAVLFLFVIMMINIKLSDILETGAQYTKNLPLALAIGSLFIYEIFTIIPFSFNNVSAISVLLDALTNINIFMLHPSAGESLSSYLVGWLNEDYKDIITFSTIVIKTASNPYIADTAFTNFLQIEAIGQNIYTYGASWLIITSVILLLAMVAPIFISKSK